MSHQYATLSALLLSVPSVSAQAQFWRMGHLPGGTDSAAITVSGDGLVVAGRANQNAGVSTGARWTVVGGLERIPGIPGQPTSFQEVTAASQDGSFLAGRQLGGGLVRAFRWSQETGTVGLGYLAPQNPGNVEVRDISPDGSTIIGDAIEPPNPAQAFRWQHPGPVTTVPGPGTGMVKATAISSDGTRICGQTSTGQAALWQAGTGVQLLGFVAEPTAMSADGSVIVGLKDQRAFRWTAATGPVLLADFGEVGPGGLIARAIAISADGTRIVGVATNVASPAGAVAVLWDSTHEVRRLPDVLLAQGAVIPAGFRIAVRAISDDGRTVVGDGVNSTNHLEGWSARLAPACYPDCNADGALNLADFGCFQTKFALGAPYADCNGDGVRNLSDFGCFQTKFALGCP